jgi:toxin ParE1/3/4
METWSEEQADLYYEQLTAFCKKLAERPEIGRKYPVIGLEVRGIIFGRHLVVYKILEPDAVEIIRILHEKMDVGSHLAEETKRPQWADKPKVLQIFAE